MVPAVIPFPFRLGSKGPLDSVSESCTVKKNNYCSENVWERPPEPERYSLQFSSVFITHTHCQCHVWLLELNATPVPRFCWFMSNKPVGQPNRNNFIFFLRFVWVWMSYVSNCYIIVVVVGKKFRLFRGHEDDTIRSRCGGCCSQCLFSMSSGWLISLFCT